MTSSLLLRWRDDASQVICPSYHDFLDGAQLFCFILCHLLESFLCSVKDPVQDFHLFVPLSSLQGEKALLHHSVRAICVIAAFNLLQILSGWRFQLPLTLYSCLPSFFGLLSKPFYSCSFLAKYIPTFIARIVFSHQFPKSSTMHLFSTNSCHCHLVNGSSPFLFSETRCSSISGINWLYMIPHLP